MNISSVVIVAQPEEADRVAAMLAGLPGVEVHARTPEGRLARRTATGWTSSERTLVGVTPVIWPCAQ